MTSISVVVCTYNGTRYLREQLESIIGQTRQPDEILVSDDASDDGSLDLARSVLSTWPGSKKLVSHPGVRGLVNNFQHAISLASGDLVALSDQDDLWHPDKLRAAELEMAARPGVDLLHSNARLIGGDGSLLPGTLLEALSASRFDVTALQSGSSMTALLRRNFVTGATVVMRRDLASRAFPVPPGWIHDEWLAIVAAATANTYLVTEPLIDYRQHGGNEIGARVLNLAAKASRLTVPRRERNARLLERAKQLDARLRQLGDAVSPDVLTRTQTKLSHERFRSALPAARVLRLPGVLGGLARGRYHRFGRGVADAVRDLVQPD